MGHSCHFCIVHLLSVSKAQGLMLCTETFDTRRWADDRIAVAREQQPNTSEQALAIYGGIVLDRKECMPDTRFRLNLHTWTTLISMLDSVLMRVLYPGIASRSWTCHSRASHVLHQSRMELCTRPCLSERPWLPDTSGR